MKRVRVSESRITIPTYIPAEYEKLPMFAENRVHQRSSGNPYPNPIVNEVRHDTKVDKEYDCIVLENDYIYLEILPEIGGRIYRALDKTNGYDFFYRQQVIKPALIGMLGLWMSGGVEFNWPIHHRPSTFAPVDSYIEHHHDESVTVWLSEHEPLNRMKGMVGIHLKPDSVLIETKVRIFNRTSLPHSFLWWENAAVPVNKRYRIFFPQDVEMVNFHYKKATGGYPIMDEYFNTQDNRGGRDIRFHANTEQATSYFSGPTEFGFFGGYDEGKKAGVIHYAPAHTSVGKKLFTWGYRTLAKTWEASLTDSDGAYAELMAGSYSDNQPDFSWIEPFEVKEFSQSWYPYKEIGEVHQANNILALSMQEGRIGLFPVTYRKNLLLSLFSEDLLLYEVNLDLEIAQPVFLDISKFDKISSIVITDGQDEVLSYKKPKKQKEYIVPEPQEDLPLPCDIFSAESAFLSGLHVAQYRDPIYEPDVYWKRALELDQHHSSSLIGLSWYYLTRLKMDEAEECAKLAFAEQTKLNPNPPTSKAAYFLGLALKQNNKNNLAKKYLQKGLWNQDGISACSLVLAQLSSAQGHYDEGLTFLNNAERFGAYNQKSKQLKISLLRKAGKQEEAIKFVKDLLTEDPLDYYAHNEAYLLGQESPDVTKRTDQNQMLLDLVSDYLDAGLRDEARRILEHTELHHPMISHLRFLCGGEFTEEDATYCFPSRYWELISLLRVAQKNPKLEQTQLLLGNIQYGIQRNYKDALVSWNNAGNDSSQALRNRALAKYRINRNDRDIPLLLLKAIEIEPCHLQLHYEYLRVLELIGTDTRVRIEAFEKIEMLARKRDDLFLLGAHTYNQAGQFDQALALLASHHFVPCEGGEHAVANEYLLGNLGLAIYSMQERKWTQALHCLKANLSLPTNLGGGVWHDVMLAPYQYLIGLCKEQLETGTGEIEFRAVYDFPINYFTDMYLPAFRIYKALAAQKLGFMEESDFILSSCLVMYKKALQKSVPNYFATTPFFEVFIEDSKSAKEIFYKHLLAFTKFASKDISEALRLCNELLSRYPSLIRTKLLKDCIINDGHVMIN